LKPNMCITNLKKLLHDSYMLAVKFVLRSRMILFMFKKGTM